MVSLPRVMLSRGSLACCSCSCSSSETDQPQLPHNPCQPSTDSLDSFHNPVRSLVVPNEGVMQEGTPPARPEQSGRFPILGATCRFPLFPTVKLDTARLPFSLAEELSASTKACVGPRIRKGSGRTRLELVRVASCKLYVCQDQFILTRFRLQRL
jgi:hypothetical protein